jgi:peptidylprolyl isomerase
VSNRVRERQLAANTAAGRPSKAERRQLGKKAAAARAAARRRQLWMKNAGPIAILVAVIAIIVVAVNVLTPGPKAHQESLDERPNVGAGTGNVTKLQVTTLIQGTGPVVQAGQTISVQYLGVNYKSGKEFDSTWDKGGTPVDFKIGVGQVIKGWDEGLVGVKVGSRVQLDIPTELAYPDSNDPDTTGPLRFVVDIISATGAPVTPSASASASGSPAPSASASASPSAATP